MLASRGERIIPSVETIAANCGFSKSTAIRTTKSLETKGWLPGVNHRRNRGNNYGSVAIPLSVTQTLRSRALEAKVSDRHLLSSTQTLSQVSDRHLESVPEPLEEEEEASKSNSEDENRPDGAAAPLGGASIVEEDAISTSGEGLLRGFEPNASEAINENVPPHGGAQKYYKKLATGEIRRALKTKIHPGEVELNLTPEEYAGYLADDKPDMDIDYLLGHKPRYRTLTRPSQARKSRDDIVKMVADNEQELLARLRGA